MLLTALMADHILRHNDGSECPDLKDEMKDRIVGTDPIGGK